MKKKIILTALILTTTTHFAYADNMFDGSLDALENTFNEMYYEAPTSSVPIVEVKNNSTQKETKGNPIFKQVRIKITNFFNERDYKNTQKLLEKEKAELEKFNENLSSEHEENDELKEDVSNSKTLELEGGVQEHVTSNDVQLDADNIDYDDETMDIIATGSPVLIFPPQNVTIKADKLVYNKASNILKAYDNVEVIRQGNTVTGDYLQINMNEENAFLDNVDTKASFLSVESEKAEMDNDKIVLYNGKMSSKQSHMINFHTRMIGGNAFHTMFIDEDERSSLASQFGDAGDTAINIKAKEVYVDAKQDHDVITLKKGQFNYGGTKLFNFRSLTAHTNKRREYFEANYPEFGSRGRIGMFAGPGFVFDTPLQGGSSLKVVPFINNKDKIGVGGFLKYRSATNFTDFGYGSSADVWILKGRQRLDDKLYLQYGANSYMDEWFIGARMPKYGVEMIYQDKNFVKSTIGENKDLTFQHRFGVGYMHNTDITRNGEKIPSSNVGTLRTRYMAQIMQNLYNYSDKEKKKFLSLNLLMQGSAALYGTGDTQFIGRIGPNLRTQYKYWMQDISFLETAYQDNSPLQRYDMYRYGRSSLVIREALRLNKFLTLAWSGIVTLSNDSPNDRMFQENAFIIALGPDDFKVNLGYDWIRGQTYFAFLIAMDAKGSSLEYEKMEIKNPDRLAKSNDKKPKLMVFGEEQQEQQITPKRMMYAEVIDIEDPDREQI